MNNTNGNYILFIKELRKKIELKYNSFDDICTDDTLIHLLQSKIWITNYTRWPWLIFLWMDIPDLGMIHRVHSVHLARVESHHVKYCSILQLFVPIKWWILSVSFNGKMYLFAFFMIFVCWYRLNHFLITNVLIS